MWNLSQARTHLGNRLAEESEVFWPATERDAAINEAQRFIAAVTKGVPLTLSGPVDSTTPYLTVSGKLLGEYPAAGRILGGAALRYANQRVADSVFPGWATAIGAPRWVIPAPHESRVYLAPSPITPMAVSVHVSVLPDDLAGDSDQLFGGELVMEKYQGALLNIAASLLLLKERYDGDAERFYQFAVQEMQAVGLDPASIPPLPRQVTQDG
jgi:hypothetical protein